MKRDIETVRDFHQYYAGRYIKARTTGMTYTVADITETTVYLRAHIRNADGTMTDNGMVGPLTLDDLTKHIYFGIPRVGMFMSGGCLFYTSTAAVRSGNRGMNLERYRFTNLTQAEHEFVGGAPVRDPRHGRADTALSTMWPEQLTPKQAWSQLQDGEAIAAALTWNFGMSIKIGYRYPVLWYRTSLIGEFQDWNQVVLDASWSQYRGIVERNLEGVRVL